MKKIRLRTDLYNGTEKISSATILRMVAGNSPQKPLSIDEIRRRVRVLDALDEAKGGDSFVLEDEDHKVLQAAVENFPWTSASKALLTIVDDVVSAEAAKPPAMKLVEDKPKSSG
jgi:hypothetical protein